MATKFVQFKDAHNRLMHINVEKVEYVIEYDESDARRAASSPQWIVQCWVFGSR